MATVKLDTVTFILREPHDFGWLKKYGTAFACIDQTGSGCVCIGMEDAGKRTFCKIAGAGTLTAEVSAEESVRMLRNALPLYEELKHPHLVKVADQYAYGPFYVAVFEWADGECLFDHWNFERYKKRPDPENPEGKV